MKTFEVQIEGEDRKSWRKIEAVDEYHAISKALEGIVSASNNVRPAKAYIAFDKPRHANGLPVRVMAYTLSYQP